MIDTLVRENCNLDKDTLSCIFGEISELKFYCNETKTLIANLMMKMEDIKYNIETKLVKEIDDFSEELENTLQKECVSKKVDFYIQERIKADRLEKLEEEKIFKGQSGLHYISVDFTVSKKDDKYLIIH